MKRIHHVVAIFARGESVLVCDDNSGKLSLPREEGKDIFIASPSFSTIFGQPVDIVTIYPEIAFKDKENDIINVYHPFMAYLPDGVEIPEGYALLDYDGFENKSYDGGTFRMLCRHFFFLPLINGNARTIPLEPEVADLASFRIQCLDHYRNRVPRGERQAYRALVEVASSPTRLSRAFHYLENVYGFRGEDYLAYRDAIHKLREDIR